MYEILRGLLGVLLWSSFVVESIELFLLVRWKGAWIAVLVAPFLADAVNERLRNGLDKGM